MSADSIPEIGFLRASQILGDHRRGLPGIIPVSPTTWWSGVRAGKFPAPVKLSPGVTAWRAEDIRALVAQMGAGGVAH
jgi:hypothetical protein